MFLPQDCHLEPAQVDAVEDCHSGVAGEMARSS